MDKPRIRVDFNEALHPDLVLLSQNDTVQDSSGNRVELSPGKIVDVYDDCGDVDENGTMCKLYTSGVVVQNTSDIEWAKYAKWLCKIDKNIQHSFDLKNK